MKKLFIILILVYICFNFGMIIDSIKDSMHKQYCYDYYRGRDVLFEKCLNE